MNSKRTFNIIYLAATILTISIFAFLVYRWYNVILEDAKLSHQKQQLEMSKTSAIGIQIFFDHLVAEMDFGTDAVNLIENEKNKNPFIFNHFLSEGVIGIYLIDNERINIITGETLSVEETKDVSKFQANEFFITDIFIKDSTINKKYFFLCKKLHPDLRNSKIFFLKIDLEYVMEKYLLPLQLTKSDFAWVLDDEGTLVYHPNHEDMVLQNIFQSNTECMECHQSFDIQKNMLINKTGFGEYTIGDEPLKIMAYAPIKIANRQWLLAISTYLPDVISELKSKLTLLLFSSTLIFLIIIGFTFFNYRANLRRIKAEEERKTAFREMKYQEELNHVSRLASLGELVDSVAHEINTPTGIISIQTDTLKIKSSKSDIAEEIDIIKKQVTRIANYTRSLLNYSRRLPFKPEPVNIISLVDDTIFLLGHRLREKKINLIKDYPSAISNLMIDRLQIEQVIINILNNACDAIKNRGEIKISLKEYSVDPDNNEVSRGILITINNSGDKIPEDIIEQIFEPFFTTKPEGKGTGLGLSISRKIILRHSGTIKVQNTETGPAFIIKLPYNIQLVN